MRAFFALIRREFQEHRGAFLYAPAILVCLLTLFVVMGFISGHYRLDLHGVMPLQYKLFDGLYFGVAALWWFYLSAALFFYFADSFNADRRNNAMFFWKSMPQSDFKILLSKLAAGMTVLPALIFLAMLVTGIVLAIAATVAPFALPILSAPDIAATAASWAGVSTVGLCYLILSLLWYAPFFAWVGALSTVFGRWSIPLALLIPAVFSLLEGVIDFGSAPGGSYVLSFLKQRLSFSFDAADMREALFSNAPLDVPGLIGNLVEAINWPSLVGGLVFAGVVIYAASEYRRRVIS